MSQERKKSTIKSTRRSRKRSSRSSHSKKESQNKVESPIKQSGPQFHRIVVNTLDFENEYVLKLYKNEDAPDFDGNGITNIKQIWAFKPKEILWGMETGESKRLAIAYISFPFHHLFPLNILNEGSILEFKTNKLIRKNVTKSVKFMINFFGYTALDKHPFLNRKRKDVGIEAGARNLASSLGVLVGNTTSPIEENPLGIPRFTMYLSDMIDFLLLIDMKALALLLFLMVCEEMKVNLAFAETVEDVGDIGSIKDVKRLSVSHTSIRFTSKSLISQWSMKLGIKNPKKIRYNNKCEGSLLDLPHLPTIDRIARTNESGRGISYNMIESKIGQGGSPMEISAIKGSGRSFIGSESSKEGKPSASSGAPERSFKEPQIPRTINDLKDTCTLTLKISSKIGEFFFRDTKKKLFPPGIIGTFTFYDKDDEKIEEFNRLPWIVEEGDTFTILSISI